VQTTHYTFIHLRLYSPLLSPGHYTQPAGLLGRGISPSQSLYLHTGLCIHRINACTHPCLNVIRTHDPRVWAGEDSSCVRLCGHSDRQLTTRTSRKFRLRACVKVEVEEAYKAICAYIKAPNYKLVTQQGKTEGSNDKIRVEHAYTHTILHSFAACYHSTPLNKHCTRFGLLLLLTLFPPSEILTCVWIHIYFDKTWNLLKKMQVKLVGHAVE
jgi:hypothetical protein